MAKLVVVTEGLSGRSHELTAERTTVGRVEDNTFPIAEPSISSHHCEILLQGSEVRIKDLNSTNGTFIDGQQINEGVLKPGQTLRLGKVDLKLEGEAPAGSAKKAVEQTMVVPRGVSLNELETGPKAPGFDTAAKGFSKRNDRSNKLFIVVVVVVVVVILGAIATLIISGGGGSPPPTGR